LTRHELLFCWIFGGLVQQNLKQGSLNQVYVKRTVRGVSSAISAFVGGLIPRASMSSCFQVYVKRRVRGVQVSGAISAFVGGLIPWASESSHGCFQVHFPDWAFVRLQGLSSEHVGENKVNLLTGKFFYTVTISMSAPPSAIFTPVKVSFWIRKKCILKLDKRGNKGQRGRKRGEKKPEGGRREDSIVIFLVLALVVQIFTQAHNGVVCLLVTIILMFSLGSREEEGKTQQLCFLHFLYDI